MSAEGRLSVPAKRAVRPGMDSLLTAYIAYPQRGATAVNRKNPDRHTSSHELDAKVFPWLWVVLEEAEKSGNVIEVKHSCNPTTRQHLREGRVFRYTLLNCLQEMVPQSPKEGDVTVVVKFPRPEFNLYKNFGIIGETRTFFIDEREIMQFFSFPISKSCKRRARQ